MCDVLLTCIKEKSECALIGALGCNGQRMASDLAALVTWYVEGK